MAPRTRVVLLVGLAAVAAAGVAVGGALLQGGTAGGEAHGQTATATGRDREPPALELALTDRDDAEARSLREAERLYESGQRDEARRRFAALLAENPSSVEAAVGAAISAWPTGTIDRLEALVERNPGSTVARLNLGLALVAEGDLEAARREWRAADQIDPGSPAALLAEDLLHPDMPPGRPRFVHAAGIPPKLARVPLADQLAALERRAERDGAAAWLLYGSVQERIGRRLAAQRAYDRAAALEPRNVAARTAAAVIRFDKDDPSRAFARLGRLTRTHPRAAVVRFHLGLVLLWLPNLEEAREQLRRATEVKSVGYYAQEARRVLRSLPDVE